MISQLLATDVPEWLLRIIDKIDWNGNYSKYVTILLFKMNVNEAILKLVKKESLSLPKKKYDYSVETFETYCPGDIIETLNLIDFNQMSDERQRQFRLNIEQAVKEHLGIIL